MHTDTAVSQVRRTFAWCWSLCLLALDWLVREYPDDKWLPWVVKIDGGLVSLQRPPFEAAAVTGPLVMPQPLSEPEVVPLSQFKGTVRVGDRVRHGPDGYVAVPGL